MKLEFLRRFEDIFEDLKSEDLRSLEASQCAVVCGLLSFLLFPASFGG